MAHAETDEVCAKLSLIRSSYNGNSYVDDDDGSCCVHVDEEPHSFSKTLTPSDANNRGSFSVPVKCANFIFPKLDHSLDPPAQELRMTDVHGEVWTFRHIYRGSPKRHLLTTAGWNKFVTRKKLVANDSVVFKKAENGELSIGIRKAKKGMEYANWWKVSAETVIEAANLAVRGQTFEVLYYPRATTLDFCVKASALEKARQVQWCAGNQFKMAFEAEDSSQISWSMGTISSVQIADPIHWPNSPWRLLQVEWDEAKLLQNIKSVSESKLLHNVKSVSPWSVELVSDIPAIFRSPFSSPPPKRPRFSSNSLRYDSLLSCLPENIPTSLQGARQSRFASTSSDHHFIGLQPGHCPVNMLIGTPTLPKDIDINRKPKSGYITLFGARISTTQENCPRNYLSNENIKKPASSSDVSGLGLGSGSGSGSGFGSVINLNDPPESSLEDPLEISKVRIESEDSCRKF